MELGSTGALMLSPSDLTDHLACLHLIAQKRGMALGERSHPRPREDAHAELRRRRGREHERRQLERLTARADGDCVDLSQFENVTAGSVAETAAAMREGRRLIHQAALVDGRWQGRVDFLRRIDAPPGLGDFAYEVVDAKLSRQVRPHVVHQVCVYNRLVASVQGRELDHAVVLLGDGTEARVDLREVRALNRRAARRLEEAVDGPPAATYPEPTDHCAICRLAAECERRRRDDDHLGHVAGASRDQRRKLARVGVTRLEELALAPEDLEVPDLAAERFSLLRTQAALQRNAREGLQPVRRHLPPQAEHGYARLPDPSPGDVFLDLEGDPYAGVDGGIEYLWGWTTADGGYEHRWAHDPAGERRALERFVEAVEQRRARHPDLHVHHYAPHERTALRSLAMRHATCEAEIDDWLRRGLLVDLHAVVRQALQVGEESYSLKALERHHGFRRLERTVREGGGSIVAYETWLESRDERLLDAIREYNREDCESMVSLVRWLRDEMRPEAAAAHGVDFAALQAPPPDSHDPPAWLPEVEALIARLHAGLGEDPSADMPDEAECRLLGHLLLSHHRENKADWWAYFDLRARTPDELVEEREAIGRLELDETVPPVPVKKSLEWTYRFPPQETKLHEGSEVEDPETGKGHTIVRMGDDHLVLRRGRSQPAPRPRALIRRSPPDPKPMRNALRAVAESVLAGDSRFRAARALLRREKPRLASGRLGPAIDDLVDATLGLDGSVLPVQGPPGTGKTWSGARMVVAALRAGRRVAITAMSHEAIQNMLRAVEQHAHEAGVTFAGCYKGEGFESPHGLVEQVGGNGDCCDDALDLVAGTPWLLSRDEHEGRFDLLVVDEAGQLALAGAVAAARCARNVVLLGDPQQLPQVNQAIHPAGAGSSALGHMIGDDAVIPRERGVLLDVSWRMHPDVCAFVSERSYAGALRSRPECAGRRITARGPLDGAGLRVIEVEHEGRSQESPEEAEAIAAACRQLLAGGATVTDDRGLTRPLTPADIMVVAPYNLAVRCIGRAVPAGVRVGTVDRFQGQEAPVVFFAMTCSSAEDVPRGLDFLFDRNRLNVAVSRAQCLAVLVHCPRLLDARCRTVEQMPLVDGACRFVEMAQGRLPTPARIAA